MYVRIYMIFLDIDISTTIPTTLLKKTKNNNNKTLATYVCIVCMNLHTINIDRLRTLEQFV